MRPNLVSSLISPAMLFFLAALLMGIPGLMRLAAPQPLARVAVRISPPRPTAGTRIIARTIAGLDTTAIRTFALTGPAGAVLFASLPVFALAYALWPRIAGRPLRADLGRWHVLFAVVPTLIAPLPAFVVFVLLSPFVIHVAAANRHGFAPSMAAWSTTFVASSRYAIGILWLTGLAMFGANALYTLRRRGEPGARGDA